jgi:hypothetical protein
MRDDVGFENILYYVNTHVVSNSNKR